MAMLALSAAHRIDLPRIVLVGADVLDELGEVTQELGFDSVLLLTGVRTYEVAGRRAAKNLEDSGVACRVKFVSDSDAGTATKLQGEMSQTGVRLIIGVGGGRVIDVAKVSSSDMGIPFVSVPTTASHDGIASSVASLKWLGKPHSVKAQSPIAVIADSRVVMESPYRYTASGCGDVLSKATSISDWRLSHDLTGEYYGNYAASLALMSHRLVQDEAEKIVSRTDEGVRTLLEALVSCGVAMSIAGNSRPCSGSEHLFSHALDSLSPNPALHGEQCGVGSIMMSKLHGLDWEGLRDTLRILRAPTTAEELHVSPDHVVEALVNAKEIRPDRFTILNRVNLGFTEARRLASECGVI